MPQSVKLILSTIGTEPDAMRIAEALVAERLVACVNVVAGVRSVYRWQGEIQKDSELLMIMKSTHERIPSLLTRLKALHPYEVPEMVVIDVAGGHLPYLDWVRAETG